MSAPTFYPSSLSLSSSRSTHSNSSTRSSRSTHSRATSRSITTPIVGQSKFFTGSPKSALRISSPHPSPLALATATNHIGSGRHRTTLTATPPPSSPASTSSCNSLPQPTSQDQDQHRPSPSILASATMRPLNGPREASLADALARAHSTPHAVAALEEYAWRSLKAGVRVRDYCSAADRIVHLCPPRGMRLALLHSPVGLLFPFGVPAATPPAKPYSPTLPSGALASLSRKQFSDTLARLCREQDESLAKAHVLEVTLEYIGRRWREGEDNVIEAIAKKLADSEAELLGVPDATRAVIPTLHVFRFQFGFVDRVQLISLLNNGSANALLNQDPAALLTAWVVRRLNVGNEPKFLASDLYNIRDRMVHKHHRETVNTILATFVLDGRAAATGWTPADAPRPRTRTLSRLSFRGTAKRKTLALPWLARSKLDDERRPSLPTKLAPPDPAPGWSRLGAFGASTNEISTPASTPPATATSTPSTAASTPRYRTLGMSHPAMSSTTLGSNLGMSMNVMSTNSLGLSSDPIPDVRAALADHLLLARYRIGPDADGWYLGGGRDKADDFLESLNGKEETRDIVLELRNVFDIHPRAYRGASFFHERDVSFDLDQYIADIGPQGDEDDSPNEHVPTRTRKRSGLKYRASMSSILTNFTSGTNLSVHNVDDFTIERATRVPVPTEKVEYRFPDQLDADPTSSETIGLGIIPRFAQSMTNLDNIPSSPTPPLKVANRKKTPLLPAFQEPDSPPKHPKTEFPSMTPPLSPVSSTTSDKPSPAKNQLRCALVEAGTRRPRTMDENRRSHRQQFRRHVIVDGEHVSPDNKTSPLEHEGFGEPPEAALKESTVLSGILPLFANASVTETQVEERLTAMIELEAKRAAARGEPFEAHAKPRVVWILEEVARELSQPHLVAAAQRVLKTLTQPASTTPPRQLTPLTTPPPRPKLSPHGKKDLTIIVPPRSGPKDLILTSPERPATSNTFGAVDVTDPISPPTPRRTPPSASTKARGAVTAPPSPAADEDRTPIPVYSGAALVRVQDMCIMPPSKSSSARTSLQSSHSAPQTPTHSVSRYTSAQGAAGTAKLTLAPSPPRTGIPRKPVPPMPPLPAFLPCAPKSFNVHAL